MCWKCLICLIDQWPIVGLLGLVFQWKIFYNVNLKCAQQGKGYCWPLLALEHIFSIPKSMQGSSPKGDIPSNTQFVVRLIKVITQKGTKAADPKVRGKRKLNTTNFMVNLLKKIFKSNFLSTRRTEWVERLWMDAVVSCVHIGRPQPDVLLDLLRICFHFQSFFFAARFWLIVFVHTQLLNKLS